MEVEKIINWILTGEDSAESLGPPYWGHQRGGKWDFDLTTGDAHEIK